MDNTYIFSLKLFSVRKIKYKHDIIIMTRDGFLGFNTFLLTLCISTNRLLYFFNARCLDIYYFTFSISYHIVFT